MSISSKKGLPVLSSAPPPLHSVVLITVLTLTCVWLLPTFQSLDQIATVETFSRRWFPELLSVRQLALVRWTIAAIIWMTSLQTACWSRGWYQKTSYLPKSRLLSVPNRLVGIKTMFPFTSWSWNLLACAFSLSGTIAWMSDQQQQQQDISIWMLRAAVICWEIAAPFSLLVAAVIRYAIWPQVLKTTGETANLKSVRNILMHNVNVVFAMTETALLGGIPVRWNDIAMGPLVGCVYVLFSWAMANFWNDTAKVGPQYIYFFLDTTLPGMYPSTAILVLLVVLLVFYALFVSTETLLNFLPGGIVVHVLFVIGVCSIMMRFRD